IVAREAEKVETRFLAAGTQGCLDQVGQVVIAEDDGSVRPKSLEELFDDVRSIHFLSYIRYLYFNVGRLAYLQTNVLVAYIFLAPAIVAGAVTLGVMQQIIRAFGRVEGSMQYLFKSWPTIVELASVYKRLREFEKAIEANIEAETRAGGADAG
ncbi:MAG: SbmA/BacA-like family transporter, partial [Pseudomonadota bacterium]|nr:SbmA/BacA-like family transporter [Pseudomonadota bacterium]